MHLRVLDIARGLALPVLDGIATFSDAPAAQSANFNPLFLSVFRAL
jgi:hypothetical protein